MSICVVGLALTVSGCVPRVSTRMLEDDPSGGSRRCLLPVAADIVDEFRPPPRPWLPGNRGITFGTVEGQVVRSVVAGVVTFAGRIAHEGYVTIRSGAGRDTTYSYLPVIDVHAGDRVTAGERIGVTGTRQFQLGYRDRGDYLDPEPVRRRACSDGHAMLVPVPTTTRPVRSG